MLTGPDDSNVWDRLGVALAGVTSLHCLLAPLLERVAPPLAGATAHLVLSVVTIGVSLPATVSGWLCHAQSRVFGWAVPGWAMLGAARWGGEAQSSEAGEVLFTVVAGVLLIVAHQLNRSLAYWHRRD